MGGFQTIFTKPKLKCMPLQTWVISVIVLLSILAFSFFCVLSFLKVGSYEQGNDKALNFFMKLFGFCGILLVVLLSYGFISYFLQVYNY